MDKQQITKFITDSRAAGIADDKIMSYLQGKGVIPGQPAEQGVAELAKETEEERKPGFIKRVAGRFEEIGERVRTSVKEGGEKFIEKAQKGDVFGASGELLRTGLRTVGAVAEGAFVPVTEAPIIRQALDLAGKGIEKLSETQFIEAIGDTKLAQSVAQKIIEKPEIAQDIMDVINILTVGAGRAVTKPVAKTVGEAVAKTGEKLVVGAEKSVVAQKESFIRDLIRPVQTKAVKEAQVARTKETGKGIFKRSIIAPTEAELRIEQAVSNVRGLSSKNTFQQNFNIIQQENTRLADDLIARLEKDDFIFPKKELKSRLNKVKEELAENPNLVGDNQKVADKLIAGFERMLEASEAKGSSLLKLRKDYDAWVQQQKGSNIFDPKTENAFSITNREIRREINKFLDEKAVKIEVKESLSQQSNLFRAMDNITPKAAIEADTAIGRAIQNMATAVGLKNRVVQQVAAVVGIGGLGAAATFAPAAAVTGALAFLAYKGGSLILKPGLRKALGELLEIGGSAISEGDAIILRAFLQLENQEPEE